VLLAALLVLAGSPALSQAGDDERRELERRCAENTTSEETLATCLDVVRTYLVPADGVDEAASPAAEKTSVSGKGESSSAAVELAGGDYLLTFSVSRPKSRKEGCIASGGLRSADDGYEVASFFVATPKGESKRIRSYVYALDAGPYYVEVDDASCPSWSADIEAVPMDLVEPVSGRVVRSGQASGRYATEAFYLDGGEYLVTYGLDGGKKGCGFKAQMMSVSDGSTFGSLVDIRGEALQRQSDSGHARLSYVEPGHYYWSVDAGSGWYDGLACPWTLTVEPT
jgi:hypothetical protein